MTLFSEIQRKSGGTNKIGLKRQGSKTEIRLNGYSLKKLSDLVTSLPISLVTPQTHRIIEEGPEYRRRLLNWGVFHVEHEYRQLVQKYNRILLQRNSALKENQKLSSVWDDQLSLCGEQIKIMQGKYVQQWFSILRILSDGIEFLNTVELSYQPGWDKTLALSECLKMKVDVDRRRGYTSVGPHRSDVTITLGDRPAREILSRGQQKLLMTLLMIGQSKLLEQAYGEKVVFLIDDFHSELDSASQEIIINKLLNEEIQAVITTIGRNESLKAISDSNAYMFHVEHGTVAQIA